jgi:hypothetical protein
LKNCPAKERFSSVIEVRNNDHLTQFLKKKHSVDERIFLKEI